eukprot:augustus_masked-scaffold_23-processed-gene-1.45-mRNA-1 protein AED:1.00 eAED:1.00 QI:0/0/0/0/1/1/2/0/181
MSSKIREAKYPLIRVNGEARNIRYTESESTGTAHSVMRVYSSGEGVESSEPVTSLTKSEATGIRKIKLENREYPHIILRPMPKNEREEECMSNELSLLSCTLGHVLDTCGFVKKKDEANFKAGRLNVFEKLQKLNENEAKSGVEPSSREDVEKKRFVGVIEEEECGTSIDWTDSGMMMVWK